MQNRYKKDTKLNTRLYEKILKESNAETDEYRKIAEQFVKATVDSGIESFDLNGYDPSVLFDEVADETGRDYDDIKDENWDVDLDVPQDDVVNLICKYHLLDINRLKELEVECGMTLEKDGGNFIDEASNYDEDFFCKVWDEVNEELGDIKDDIFREVKQDIMSC